MTDFFFDYELPERLIAQEPAARRDDARLLVVDRKSGRLAHHRFRELPQLLHAGDRLILNDTKVIPARLIGRRVNTEGAWEALFLRTHDNGDWELMAKTRGYPRIGEAFRSNSGLTLIVTGRTEDKHWLMRPEQPGTAEELLAQYGEIPLPPYIRKGRAQEGDAQRYQTVYAEAAGSVAAPTAGLHFTPELLTALSAARIDRSSVTLHVGLATFAPVKVEDPTKHAIHAEWCAVSDVTVREIATTKANRGRIVAVGTTTTRTLESAAQSGQLCAYRAATTLFVHPPFPFRVLDALITNFHLPRTTLLLLVQAFSGGELLRSAYEEAIREGYRFYSYGDAMLIV
jgi:S-adenosylmethionine:tRNA ribosyltransferase-isomerase